MLVDFTIRRNNCENKKHAAKKQKILLGGEKRPLLAAKHGCPLSPLYYTKRQKLSPLVRRWVSVGIQFICTRAGMSWSHYQLG